MIADSIADILKREDRFLIRALFSNRRKKMCGLCDRAFFARIIIVTVVRSITACQTPSAVFSQSSRSRKIIAIYRLSFPYDRNLSTFCCKLLRTAPLHHNGIILRGPAAKDTYFLFGIGNTSIGRLRSYLDASCLWV